MQFKKVELGHSCLVGAKDRKTLRSRMVKALSLNDAQAECLLPAKVTLSVAKISGTRHSVYLSEHDPWLVQFQDGRVLPTIYALWNTQPLLPSLQIHEAVVTFIMRGAHLMIPGVRNWSTDFKAGSFAMVTVIGNPNPVAVGICENPIDETGRLRTTGRALEVLHYYGDGLCKLSPKKFPNNSSYSPDEMETMASMEQTSEPHSETSTAEPAQNELPSDKTNSSAEKPNLAEQKNGASELSDQSEKTGGTHDQNMSEVIQGLEKTTMETPIDDQNIAAIETVTFPVPLVDMTLRICFLQTIHSITNDRLPMDISALYGQMVAEGAKIVSTTGFKRLIKEADMWDDNISSENAVHLISYKKSSYKKLVKLFQAWSKEGLISTKDARGVTSVVQINRASEKYLKFTPINLSSSSSEKPVKKNEKLVIKRWLAFSATQRKALAQLGVQVDNQPMTLDQYKRIVIQHISNEGSVIMDHIEQATQYHQIVRGEEEAPIVKGRAQPITVAVEPRGNRKHITVVKGLFNYLFNMDESVVLETLRRKFASAVSVNNGVISIQGRVPVKNELIEHFGLSQQHIKLL